MIRTWISRTLARWLFGIRTENWNNETCSCGCDAWDESDSYQGE